MNSKENLIKLAKTYSSEKDFKTRNLPKYLLMKNRGILREAFPRVQASVKTYKGIYKAYNKNKVVFIGYSLDNVLEAIKDVSEKAFTHTHVDYHRIESNADIIVLYHYLVNLHRPHYNTNVQKQKLSLVIPNASKILGKQLKT